MIVREIDGQKAYVRPEKFTEADFRNMSIDELKTIWGVPIAWLDSP